MLTKLTAVSPDPMNLLMQITFAITCGQPLRMNAFSISFVLLHRKDLNLWDYNLIGVNQPNRRRTFSSYYNEVKINNFIIQVIECVYGNNIMSIFLGTASKYTSHSNGQILPSF